MHEQNKQQAGSEDFAFRIHNEYEQNLPTSQQAARVLAQGALFTPDIVRLFTSQCSGVNNPIYIHHHGGVAVLQCDDFLWGLAEMCRRGVLSCLDWLAANRRGSVGMLSVRER